MADYTKLREVTEEIDGLIKKGVVQTDPEFHAWQTKAERALIKVYGEDSYELKEFKKVHFSLVAYSIGTPRDEFARKCAKGLETVKAVFTEYLSEDIEVNTIENKSTDYKKIFIVHGHDGELKAEVALLLQKQGIEGVILSEQVNIGRTIIEKFEDNSEECSAAIVLFTADDEGKAKKEVDYHSRARQNVVFEAGYFMGKYGRDKVIMIADKGIEIPSDLQGVVYTDSNNWKFEVIAGLKAIGYSVDANKLL